jgi:predicted permease
VAQPMSWRSRLRALVQRRRVERAMDDEMRFHLEMETQDLLRQGLSAEEARRRAALAFGGVERYKEEARDAWGVRWLEELRADLRFSARSLRRTPVFTAVAVLALGLGIGANSIVFSFVDAVAFRPLPVERPQDLVALYGAREGADLLNLSYPTYEDVRRAARGFSDAAAFADGPVTLSEGGTPDVVWAQHPTANYFSLLGVRPELGRLLRPGDDHESVVVLGHSLWVTRFAGDRAVVGRRILINGSPFTVIGVAPPEFLGTRLFSYAPALWVPLGMHRQTIPGSDSLLVRRVGGRFQVVARLRDGVTRAQAAALADAVVRRLAETYPTALAGWRIRLVDNRTPINPWLASPERLKSIGRLLLLGVGLVLLVACANVANLLLARMSARRREVAIRLSLGASRGRLVRQFLTESLVLAGLGVVAALPLALLTIQASAGMSPPVDYTTAFRPVADARVLVFTAVIGLVAGIIFGLAPALQTASPEIAATLRDGAAGPGSRRSRLRNVLVVGQIAVSLVVLVAAGLFTRSLENARALDPGFRVDGAVVFTLDPQLIPSYDAARTAALYRVLLDRLHALPGVQSVTRASGLPLDGSSSSMTVFAEGRAASVEDGVRVDYTIVGLDYFATLGTPIVEGRSFVPGDSAGPMEGAVINDVLARRLWPGEPAVGKRIRLGSAEGDAVEVIGTSRATKYRQLGEAPRPAMTLTTLRNPVSRSTVLVRTAGDLAALYPAIRREVARLDPGLPIVGLKTLRDHIAVSYSAAESGAWATTGFGILALLLAASGIYGVVSYAVSQRTRELAVRVALGARRGQVVRLVVGSGVRLALLGIAVGVIAALAVTRGLAEMLYDVAPYDPVTFVGVALGLGAIAVVASLVPAWRAQAVDPSVALRAE